MQRLVIGDLPRVHARRDPHATAYIDGTTLLTWGDVNNRVGRLAAALRDRFGVRAGARVAVLADNCHEFVEIMFACSRLAAMYTGLNTRHNVKEMAAQIADAEPLLIIASQRFDKMGHEVACVTNLPVLFLGSGPEGYEALLASIDSAEEDEGHGDVDAPYSLAYTSGTTGEPKGAMITSRGEFNYVHSLAWAAETRFDDVFIAMLPMFHKGGQMAVMHPAYFGLPTVLIGGIDADAILEAIERHRVTFFLAVPAAFPMLLEARKRVEHRDRHLSSLRHVQYGGNATPVPVLREFSATFGCAMSQIGGVGTEGGVALTLTRIDHEQALNDPTLAHRLRSCGKVQPPFEMRIVDEGDQPTPVGVAGEMVFRGDAFIPGYWNRPVESQRLWCGGWLHSGDIGRVDEDGYVYFVDRAAGRIKTGGETVYAREVENVLRTHSAVSEVAVVGVPDAKWDEAVWAVVERSHGSDLPDEELEADLRQHVRESLSGFKVPKRVIFIDELPRTALGKLAIGVIKQTMSSSAS